MDLEIHRVTGFQKVGPQVRLDPEAGILVWPNGADFDPATLHALAGGGSAAGGFSAEVVVYHCLNEWKRS